LYNLILNENMKIYRRIRTWILIAVLVAITATMLIIIHSNSQPIAADDNWKARLQQQIDNDKRSLDEKGIPLAAKKKIEADIKTNEYRLAHNLQPSQRSVWAGVMNAGMYLIGFVTIFTVIIAADSVAGEFSGGTIKLLLIRPASRTLILLSKYISTLIFALVLLIILFLFSFVLSGILEGFTDVGLPYIYTGSNGVVHEVSMIFHVLSTYGYQCVALLMIVTMAFMLSTVFRSSSLSIGLSLGIMFIGSGITAVISQYGWAKYYLFENTDLTQYLNDSPNIEGMTLQFSIIVLLVYFLIFNALSWTIFNKRDVAA
jgi:ABC-2 type transport system permease protein